MEQDSGLQSTAPTALDVLAASPVLFPLGLVSESSQRVPVEELDALKHDLRNPLQGMVFGLELLRWAPNDPAVVDAVIQRLENNVRRMRALLDAQS